MPPNEASEAAVEVERILRKTKRRVWKPLPGPQQQAYETKADILFYGGAAGGGKTDLLIGLAATAHHRSIIFRREFPQLRAIVDRSKEVLTPIAAYNKVDNLWRFKDGRLLEFGAVQYDDDKLKYQGRPHDFKGFDELPNFLESQFRFLIGWNRTTVKGQRTRVVGAGNPPTNADGEWVIRFFAPWLDEQHTHPAEPGELRWFAVVKGEDVEVDSGTPIERNGEVIKPKSRTFIPARLTDNPYLMETDYMSVLQAMPEPLRSQMLYGDFAVGTQDDAWQVIPTAWVRAAQARWQPQRVDRYDALGIDVSRGGDDKTVIAPRIGIWFDELRKFAGEATPDGHAANRHVDSVSRTHVYENIDVIGVGASLYDMRKMLRENVNGVNVSNDSDATDKSGKLGFVNLRAELWWKFREALDPAFGIGIALPPDRELLADLTAPRWKIAARGIQVESKEDIKKRIGRSPDCGDAVVLALYTPPSITGFSRPYDQRSTKRKY